MLNQGVMEQYHDGHSPLLVRLWKMTGLLKVGPAIPYFIACAGTLILVAMLLQRLFNSYSVSTISLLLFCAFPPVFASLGFVTKDLFFAGSMLLALLATLHFLERKTSTSFALLTGAMFLAILVRIDAIFALIPFALLLSHCAAKTLFKKSLSIIFSTILMAGTFCALLVFSSKLINKYLFHAEEFHAEQVTLLFDLASISIQVNKELIPESRLGVTGYPLSLLRARFNPGDSSPIIWGNDGLGLVYSPSADQRELMLAWIHGVKSYPREYLLARAEYASRYLGFRNDNPAILGQFVADETLVASHPEQGWQQINSPLHRVYAQLANTNRWTHVVYLPWLLCLVAAASALILAGKTFYRAQSASSHLAVQLLFTSGVTYTFFMCLVSTASEARYHSWPRIGFTLVILFLIVSAASRTQMRETQES